MKTMLINPSKFRVSPNFTLRELIRSDVATDLGIDNTPNEAELSRLSVLTWTVLQPARDKLGPLWVTSGFRCRRLNSHPRIGGVMSSQHTRGEAADVWKSDLAPLFLFILNNLPFDQIIWEYGKWVHVSVADQPRHEALVTTSNGFVPYRRETQLVQDRT